MRIVVAGPVDLLRTTQGSARCPVDNGRGSPVVTNLVLGLKARGHDVAAVTLSAKSQGVYLDGAVPTFVGRDRSRLRWIDAFRAERREVDRGIKLFKPDLVHAHWTYEFALPAISSATSHIITVRDWGPEILKYHPHPYRLVRLGMQVATLVRGEHLTANSPYIAEWVHRVYRRRIPTIPNGIHFPTRVPTRPPFDIEAPRIGSINNGFSKHKNVTALIRAFKFLRTIAPRASLRLVGDGYGPRESAEMFARQHDAHDGIDFVGRIPSNEVAKFLADIDVLVHPSLEESFGTTLIEAIAAGVLVIGGRDSGAVPWLLDNGRSGQLVNVRRPEAIVAAIRNLPKDGASQQAQREAAFVSASTRFSQEKVLDAYEDLYEQVITAGHG